MSAQRLNLEYERVKQNKPVQNSILPGKSILKNPAKEKLFQREEKKQVKLFIQENESNVAVKQRHQIVEQIEEKPQKKVKLQQNQYVEEEIHEKGDQGSQQDSYDVFDELELKQKKQEEIPEEDQEGSNDLDPQQERELLEGLDLSTNTRRNDTQNGGEIDILDNFERKWNKHKDSRINSMKYKIGKFSDQETKIVFKSLLDYATNKQLSEEEIHQICSDRSKKEFPKAWIEIAKVLPNRTLQSIHNLVHRKFNPVNNQGIWSAEEEQHLLQLVEEHGRKWYEISKMINRTPLNVRDKFKSMGEENNSQRDQSKWTLGEVLGLLLYIQRYVSYLIDKLQTGKLILKDDWLSTVTERLGETWHEIDVKQKIFKFRQGKRRSHITCDQDQNTLNTFCYIIDKDQLNNLEINNIPWTKIAHKIKSKSKDDIRNFWYLTLNLWFLQPSNIDLTQEEDFQIIQDICAQNIENDNEIDYELILQHSQLSVLDKQQKWHYIKKRVSLRKNLTTSQILGILQNQIKQQKEFQVNVSFGTLQTTQTDITPSFNIKTKHKNLFQTLLEKYRELQQDMVPTFSDIEE